VLYDSEAQAALKPNRVVRLGEILEHLPASRYE
jgi:hypothetical protein